MTHELGHSAGIYERHLTLGKRLVLQEYVIDFYVRIDDGIADAYDELPLEANEPPAQWQRFDNLLDTLRDALRQQ